jgi:hypothetical protein
MYKCRLCDAKFNELEDLYKHLEDEHGDSIPKNFSSQQYYYYLKTGKDHGTCIVCKMDTSWNESTNKYHRFCEMKRCKEKYKEEFRQRMIGKYGRVHLLSDPEQQKKMLANRSISGKYKWSDGKEIQYTGTYELDFLRFLDNFMNFDSEDVISPSPHTYYYLYEGEEKFYIPDFFIPSLNLEIEIKDGGSNPNTHHKIQAVDKVKEKLKDEVLSSQKQFSYIKITDKNYDAFFDLLMRMKKDFEENGERKQVFHILNESITIPQVNGTVLTESFQSALEGFTRTELRMDYFNMLYDKATSDDDLFYLVTLIDAERKAMEDKTTDYDENFETQLTELRQSIVERMKEQFQDRVGVEKRLNNYVNMTEYAEDADIVEEGYLERTAILIQYYRSVLTGSMDRQEMIRTVDRIDEELEDMDNPNRKVGINVAYKKQLQEIKKGLEKRIKTGDLFPQ